MRALAVCLLAAVLSCLPASADRVEEAFAAGQFLKAAEIAETLGGADNEARAARALLADAVVTGTPAFERLDEAERLANSALQEAPDHIEARLQLAIALSLKSRNMSNGEAFRSGYGKRARELVTSVLEDDPDNVYAHGFLAVWNVEVLRRGGRLGAAWMGASLSEAREHYSAAAESAASGAPVHWQYARALAALDARKYGEDIRTLLARAEAEEAPTALDRKMQARARSFHDYMQTHSRKEIEQAAKATL